MKSRGMAYFNKEHWQKNVEDVNVGGSRYASEMNTAEEYKKSVDKLAGYVKKHKAEH